MTARGARARALPGRQAQPLPGAVRGRRCTGSSRSPTSRRRPVRLAVRARHRCHQPGPRGAHGLEPIRPSDSLLPRLAAEKPGALLVVGDGRLVGIVTRSDVISAIQHAVSCSPSRGIAARRSLVVTFVTVVTILRPSESSGSDSRIIRESCTHQRARPSGRHRATAALPQRPAPPAGRGLADGLVGAALRARRGQRRADPARPRVLRAVRQARRRLRHRPARRPHPAHPRLGPRPPHRDRRRGQPRLGDRAVRRAAHARLHRRGASSTTILRKVGHASRRPDRSRHLASSSASCASRRSGSASSRCRPRRRRKWPTGCVAAGIQVILNYSTAFVDVPERRDAAQHRSGARTAAHAVLPVARRRRGGRLTLVVRYSLACTRPTGIGRSLSSWRLTYDFDPVLAIAMPFLGGIGAQELIIILVIVLVLFGPKRLPQLGKTLGKTMKAIREGAEGKLAEDDEEARRRRSQEGAGQGRGASRRRTTPSRRFAVLTAAWSLGGERVRAGCHAAAFVYTFVDISTGCPHMQGSPRVTRDLPIQPGGRHERESPNEQRDRTHPRRPGQARGRAAASRDGSPSRGRRAHQGSQGVRRHLRELRVRRRQERAGVGREPHHRDRRRSSRTRRSSTRPRRATRSRSGCKVKLKDAERRASTSTRSSVRPRPIPPTTRSRNESPVGQAIIGHKKGEIVEVTTPSRQGHRVHRRLDHPLVR